MHRSRSISPSPRSRPGPGGLPPSSNFPPLGTRRSRSPSRSLSPRQKHSFNDRNNGHSHFTHGHGHQGQEMERNSRNYEQQRGGMSGGRREEDVMQNKRPYEGGRNDYDKRPRYNSNEYGHHGGKEGFKESRDPRDPRPDYRYQPRENRDPREPRDSREQYGGERESRFKPYDRNMNQPPRLVPQNAPPVESFDRKPDFQRNYVPRHDEPFNRGAPGGYDRNDRGFQRNPAPVDNYPQRNFEKRHFDRPRDNFGYQPHSQFHNHSYNKYPERQENDELKADFSTVVDDNAEPSFFDKNGKYDINISFRHRKCNKFFDPKLRNCDRKFCQFFPCYMVKCPNMFDCKSVLTGKKCDRKFCGFKPCCFEDRRNWNNAPGEVPPMQMRSENDADTHRSHDDKRDDRKD